MSMDSHQQEAAYQLARAVHEGRMDRKEAETRLHEEVGINASSARFVIGDYVQLRRGLVFKRALNASDLNFMLKRIADDAGVAGLEKALAALREHIAYREGGNVSQRGNRVILQAFEARLEAMRQAHADVPPPLDEWTADFQRRVAGALRDPAGARRQRLASAPRRPGRLTRTVTVFDRNPDVVAEVIARAVGHCEGCRRAAPFLRRSDDTPYLEVHHVVQLAHGGEDTVENAVALCPNCHRERHHGVAPG